MDGRVVLGPMSGFSSRGYREFMEPFGVAVSVTEMTSDKGIIHGTGRTEHGFVSFESDTPTGLQIFGHDPKSMGDAASKALRMNPNISFIDINMGCPVPKISRSGAGSVLMKDPVLCGSIVRSVKGSVDVPVTVKLRLGWSRSSMNYREVIDEIISAGVDAITLHPRTRDEGYTGHPHYDLVEGLGSEIDVPLIISGNIYSVDDAVRAMDRTHSDAVMVARGGVGNPFLVTQIDSFYRGMPVPDNPTISEQVHWCLDLADRLIAEKGTTDAMAKLRSMAPKFIAGCDWCREYRYRLATETVDRDALLDLLMEIEHDLGNQRIRSPSQCDPSL